MRSTIYAVTEDILSLMLRLHPSLKILWMVLKSQKEKPRRLYGTIMLIYWKKALAVGSEFICEKMLLICCESAIIEGNPSLPRTRNGCSHSVGMDLESVFESSSIL